MWNVSHWCDDGVVVCRMQWATNPDDFIVINCDVAGEFSRETWIEVPKGWVVVDSFVMNDSGFVSEFSIEGGQTIRSSEQPCLCAGLTSMVRTLAWLKLGGIQMKAASA